MGVLTMSERPKIAGREIDVPESAGSLPPMSERYEHLREKGARVFEQPSPYEKVRALRPSRREFFQAVLDAAGPVSESELRRRVDRASDRAKEQCKKLASKGLLSSEIRCVDGERRRFWRLAESVDPDKVRKAFEAGDGGE